MTWALYYVTIIIISIFIIIIILSKEAYCDIWIVKPFYQKIRYLAEHPPKYAYVLADKLRVKFYLEDHLHTLALSKLNIAKLIYYTNETLPKLSNILQSNKRYIMKANNAPKHNIIISLKSDPDKLATKIKEWLTESHVTTTTEKFYGAIKPYILIEEYINNIILRFRLYCFHGKVQYIKVNNVFYTSNWRISELSQNHNSNCYIDKPSYLAELIDIAEKLTRPIAFTCLDLFATDANKLYFEGFTFCPSDSTRELMPEKYQRILSKHWKFCDS